jgi:cytochrome c oxidase subunit 1
MGPDAGWFGYVPLSSTFSPGKRVDLWADLISLTEISALVVAVSLITTICKQRAPGMSLDRIPLYVWSLLVQSFMVVFAMPAVMLATGYLATDRLVGTQIFNYAEGGDVLLWQHMFWFFGHPEVYIIFVPALGIVSAIIEAFTRRPVFGYPAMVASLVATGIRQLRPLGAPHVRHRAAAARRELLHRREHDHLGPPPGCRSSAGWRRSGPGGW